MERITESEEKSRDIGADKNPGIADNNTADRDLRGENDGGGIRDLDDLDFGDLDPADLGFTDPCFGDPGRKPDAKALKADAPKADAGDPEAVKSEAVDAEAGKSEPVETDADPGNDSGEHLATATEADAGTSGPTEENAGNLQKEEAAGSEVPKDVLKEEAANSDTAPEGTAADADKNNEEPPAVSADKGETEQPPAEPDIDADIKIRKSRKKRVEAEEHKRSKTAPPPKRRRSAEYDEDDDYYDDYDEDGYDEDDYDEDDYDDFDEEELEEERRSQKIWLTFLLVSFLVVGVVGGVFYGCTVKNVYVKGNTLYTSEEIAERVISDDSQLRHNTVFLTLLYHTPFAPKIPFVEKVDVKPDSYDTITITVKDKKLAGYIPYGGRNIYFSADGITLENSPLTVKGVTYVTGVTLNEAEIGMPLSSENPEGLALVLDALKILRKYEIEPESVVLTQNGSVTMFIGDVKVILGRSDYELKIAKIAQILPYLEGRKGTIDLTNYTSSDQNIILK